MGILVGFAPWIVYWVLVGNAPFTTAVLVALAVAIIGLVMGRTREVSGLAFEIGSVAALFVLAVLTFVASRSFLEQWILPLSTAGIFVIALAGAVSGTPFVRGFAGAGRPDEIVTSEPFTTITSLLTWIWIAAFAGMTVSSAIPPIVSDAATIRDSANPLYVLCYWVIPFALLGLAAVASRILPDTMVLSDDVVRETSFVAYSEAAIDELYYLAQEHANREVGAGKEAYDVKVGGMGMTLTGDESRKSWPSTYRVRDRRR